MVDVSVDAEVLVAGTKAMPGIGSFWVPTDVQPCLILGLLVALEHVCRENVGRFLLTTRECRAAPRR